LPSRPTPPRGPGAFAVADAFHPTLRRLLVAEIFTRWCDWLVREFVVLYLLVIRGMDATAIGLLFALQNLVSLLTYLPVGRLTRVVGLQPFIGFTFVFFALFPLALSLAPDGYGIVLAFVVWGLRELGEPARKALIVSLLPVPIRAQGVGPYWGIRGAAICWAPLMGALVWWWLGPDSLLYLAFGFGCSETFATVPSRIRPPAGVSMGRLSTSLKLRRTDSGLQTTVS